EISGDQVKEESSDKRLGGRAARRQSAVGQPRQADPAPLAKKTGKTSKIGLPYAQRLIIMALEAGLPARGASRPGGGPPPREGRATLPIGAVAGSWYRRCSPRRKGSTRQTASNECFVAGCPAKRAAAKMTGD